jgi:hypothetical protein
MKTIHKWMIQSAREYRLSLTSQICAIKSSDLVTRYYNSRSKRAHRPERTETTSREWQRPVHAMAQPTVERRGQNCK